MSSIVCSDQSLSPLSSVPSATILSNSLVNCSWSSLSVSDSTICCAANVIKPITASGIDQYIWGCMLINPATPSLMFSNPGMYDLLGKFAQASSLQVCVLVLGGSTQLDRRKEDHPCSNNLNTILVA
ncbi:MAG: hypothetical protein EZS28_054611 [Streblomastix strix]|uniref:Uncharacterized protein n=1 Tax=Streblomastix strix TaxID=222440 RepID=A0A5J4QGC4_9EUKA|nr:MAG: hypothetical protein EZS28_054611 [Streblomastix strix]